MSIKNDLLIKALLRQGADRAPIWMLRQAGRYLPEYRKLRSQADSFMDFCRNPELACEATLQPLRRFGLDAAIIFSDILTIPDALQCGLKFIPGQGPVLSNPIRDGSAVAALPNSDISSRCDYVYAAIARTKAALAGEVPLIGFSGSPWTLACYMVEGASSKDFMLCRRFLRHDPQAMHALLDYLAEQIIHYCQRQIDAGADVIMLFDSWGGLLGPEDYRSVSLAYISKIINALCLERSGQKIPCIVFSKGAGGHSLPQMAESGADAISIDWSVDLSLAVSQVGDRVALQGNLDPSYLYAQPDVLRQQVAKILHAAAPATGFVFNLGHGIDKNTPLDAVKQLVTQVQGHKF